MLGFEFSGGWVWLLPLLPLLRDRFGLREGCAAMASAIGEGENLSRLQCGGESWYECFRQPSPFLNLFIFLCPTCLRNVHFSPWRNFIGGLVSRYFLLSWRICHVSRRALAVTLLYAQVLFRINRVVLLAILQFYLFIFLFPS